MSEHRSLILRSNRLLGAALVEHNLITVEQLDEANERLLLTMDDGTVRQMCLLDILMNGTHALTEDRLLEHTVDDLGMALLDLRQIEPSDDVKIAIDPAVCWATWTVPFDQDEEISYVASAYHLSTAVRQFWEKRLGGTLVWFGATLDSVSDFLEALEAERNGNTLESSAPQAGAA